MDPQKCHTVKGFKVPEFFDQKLAVITDGRITSTESKLFYSAMVLVAMMAEVSPPLAPLLGLNVYFMESDSITFSLGKDIFGCFHQAIVFPVGHWREQGLTSDIMLVTMVEELCHAVWLIPDGPLIEEKVRETFEQIPAQFSIPDFLTHVYEKIGRII